MEVRFAPSQPLLGRRQDELLKAASSAQIHTFGWPIGVVLESPEEFKPSPIADGIVAGIQRAEEHAFDYWSLRRDGSFYLMQSLFEDQRASKALFFDTRIVRIAETLLSQRCCRQGRPLGVQVAGGRRSRRQPAFLQLSE
jgi:hypothetical protein